MPHTSLASASWPTRSASRSRTRVGTPPGPSSPLRWLGWRAGRCGRRTMSWPTSNNRDGRERLRLGDLRPRARRDRGRHAGTTVSAPRLGPQEPYPAYRAGRSLARLVGRPREAPQCPHLCTLASSCAASSSPCILRVPRRAQPEGARCYPARTGPRLGWPRTGRRPRRPDRRRNGAPRGRGGLGVGVPTARGDSWFRAAAPTPRGRLPRGLPPLLVLSLKHRACPADALRGGWDVRVRSRKRQRRRPETASSGTVRDPTCGPFHFVRLASLLPGGGKRSTCGG
jgi:hypothetical protein